MFLRKAAVPDEISATGLGEWYSSLSDQDKIKLRRYLNDADTASRHACLSSVANAAVLDENYSFAVFVCEECMRYDMTDVQKFLLTETTIEAYTGAKRYDDAKRCCELNLSLYSKVSSDILKINGGKLPEKICCRSRYIDIVVGVESGYDEAFVLLDRFFNMGLIDEEELAYRKRSLMVHRLQRSFDGIYSYSYIK